ncbi:DUF3696 domain-containing protein [Rhodovulum kholense]|uniref:Uncharacterized protein DUF3696 n=1 Tax=Rhodovulum kholense TaxID=453584 RepID=A0A8E2VGJ9_9RHOB|nr:DUF3696 domain-containing protein [Rhodovulum kholense]PTW37597.1 uncharacterized protein DUF3696 [Rhodovulum kholense]
MAIKSIIVENYRGFHKETQLDVKPITILIGRNSSGKSSLIRLVPLLQQSISTASSAPLLWDGDLVDLGTITDVVSRKSPKSEVRIGFLFSAPDFSKQIRAFSRFFYYHEDVAELSEDSTDVKYIMRLANDNGRTLFSGVTLRINSQELVVDWDDNGLINRLELNGERYSLDNLSMMASTGDLVPSISRSPSMSETGGRTFTRPFFYPEFAEAVEKVLHGRLSGDKADFIASRLGFYPKERMKEQLLQLPHIVKKRVTEAKSAEISNLSFINQLPEILEYIKEEIQRCFLNSAYIGPARASTERFDRIQELAVDRLASGGENTAVYLHSMNDSDAATFNRLMNVATGHSVKAENSGPNHVSVLVSAPGTTEWENVADVGFGFSQIIPVVAQLHAVTERHVDNKRRSSSEAFYAVEQPELHLHPAMQGNLADLFASAVNNANDRQLGLRILAETHSQNIVTSLGFMIAAGNLQADDVSIVFVEKDSESGESSLRTMAFDENGEIPNWPIGFFSV